MNYNRIERVTPYTQINPDRAMPDLADYLTPQEAANELGFNLVSIYRMIKSGKLEAIRVGKWQLLISRSSLLEYKQKLAGNSKHNPWIHR